ncbi:MAG: DUF4924 family protein [Bacteroidales bacterium]|nr:DUF4924 family protein [Bacteroidales bacterium]MBN2819351.1 DUF4924 family protein [Bacteroidales bacterium]
MLVARERRKKNVSEYVLYMWQVEDTLRALNFNMDLVEEKIIAQFKQKGSKNEEIRDWYANLILSMHEEGIKTKGHLKIVTAVIDELYELHKRLIFELKDPVYFSLYEAARESIIHFKQKLQKPDANEVEVCFYGLYGLLLLRLKNKEIGKQTKDAMQTFSAMLSGLTKHFHMIEQGKAEF